MPFRADRSSIGAFEGRSGRRRSPSHLRARIVCRVGRSHDSRQRSSSCLGYRLLEVLRERYESTSLSSAAFPGPERPLEPGLHVLPEPAGLLSLASPAGVRWIRFARRSRSTGTMSTEAGRAASGFKVCPGPRVHDDRIGQLPHRRCVQRLHVHQQRVLRRAQPGRCQGIVVHLAEGAGRPSGARNYCRRSQTAWARISRSVSCSSRAASPRNPRGSITLGCRLLDPQESRHIPASIRGTYLHMCLGSSSLQAGRGFLPLRSSRPRPHDARPCVRSASTSRLAPSV